MKISYLIILMLLIANLSIAQTKLPYPINTEFIEYSPALLPDSSIMLISLRESNPTCLRFVNRDGQWILESNDLTSKINALNHSRADRFYFRFSSDFQRLIVAIEGRVYESKFSDSNWSLFVELFKDQQIDVSNAPSYSSDSKKLYLSKNNLEYAFYAYDLIGNEWSNVEKVDFSKDQIAAHVMIGIGNASIIFSGWYDNPNEKNAKAYFYVKKLNESQWSSPSIIEELDGNSRYSLTLDGGTMIGTDAYSTKGRDEGNVFLIETPDMLKTEIANSRNLNPSKNIASITTTRIDNQEPKRESIGSPTYHALLIGISDYKNNNQDLKDLDNPVNDAQKLKDVLVENYTFAPSNVRVLENPNRAEFINELENLSKKVQEKDNLLIFYAGHGIFDKNLNVGYWLPADATTTSKANWISNSTIRDYLAGVDSKHTLLISDACFSGSIFKTREVTNTLDNFGFARMYKHNSRKAITSGTLNTVPDESVFLQYLIKRLSENKNQYLPSGWLFHDIEAAVINNTSNIPQYGTIQNSGDEGGDFIFIRK